MTITIDIDDPGKYGDWISFTVGGLETDPVSFNVIGYATGRLFNLQNGLDFVVREDGRIEQIKEEEENAD